jgi:hypothetical protein
MPLASPKYAFNEWTVAGAPTDAGLYALYDGDRLLCIGVAGGRGPSDSIRSRLMAHYSDPGRKAGVPSHYQWEITSNPLQRRAEYLTTISPALRCEDPQVASKR